MKKRAKRLTALLLSLAMALSMLSATAWATNGSDTGTGAVSATTSTTGTGDSATSSDSSSAVAGSMGILDALDSTTLSAIVAVAEAEAAAAAKSNDGIATISDDEDEETDIMLAEAAEEAADITVIDEDGNSSALTEEQLQTVLYLYQQYLEDYNEHVGYLGRQTPWFTSYEQDDGEDGLGPLGSILVLAGVTVDDVRNGNYTYDELVGTIQTFYYGNYYGVEYYGSDIVAAKNEALAAVEASGAITEAQKLLVLNEWLADNVSFDMAYIMNMSSDDYDMMSAPEPENSEHYDELYNVFYNMYYDTMVESYGETYGPVYAQYAAAQMVTAVEGMWNGNLVGALALGKGVCMAYTSAYTYLVQYLYPEVYSVNGTLTTDSSTWKTVEELNYKTTTTTETTTSTDWDGVTYYSVTEDSSEGEEGGDSSSETEPEEGGDSSSETEPEEGGDSSSEAEPEEGEVEAAAEEGVTLNVTTGTTVTDYPYYTDDDGDGEYTQATDEEGNLLYVQDYDAANTTTDNTGYPVYVTTTSTEEVTTTEISTDADYMVDFVMIVYDTSVSMYGESNDDFSSQHFWNAVKIDGEWYYIDTCYIDTYTESMDRTRVETIGDMNHVYFLMSDTSAREMYDGYYSALVTLYEGVATDTSYENTTWMYFAASNVYSDGNGKFYYAYDSTDLFDMMDQYGDYMSDSGTSTAAEDDYSSYEDDTEYKIVYHTATSSDKDTADDYVTLIDITGGQVYNPSTGALEDSELIAELYAEHEAYEELYPALSLTMALYNNVIYFNLANCVLSYDISTGEVVKVKEYNDVYAVRDTSEAFGGMAFSVTYDEEDYDVYESNPPIAGLAIYDDTLYVDVASNYAYISGKDDINDLTSYGWEFAESNYNASYSFWLSMIDMSEYGDYDMGDYMDDENDNDEFMWSANFTDSISMSTVTSSSLTYEEVYVAATCGRDAFTEERSEEGLINPDVERVYDEGTACEHHFVEFDETYYTKDDNGNWNTGVNYVCTICGLSVTDEDTDEDEVEVTYEQAAALAAEGHDYVATEDGITWTENEDGTYSATVTDMICSVCSDMKTNTVYVATVTDNDDGSKTVTNSGETETVYNIDCLAGDDTIEVTLDEALTCDMTYEVSGECATGLTTTYYAAGPEGSDYEGMILGSIEVQGEAGTHDYVVEDDDWTWTENEDGTYSCVATVMTCSVCGDVQEDVEAVVTSETTPATCTEAGATVYTAVATIYDDDENAIGSASTTLTVEIAATGHTEADAVVENNVEPTCTEDGSYDSVVYCATCGEELSRETITVDALGHTWGDTVWGDWTETESSGYTITATRTCTVCGEVETADVEVSSTSEDADCTTPGTVTYTAVATYSDGTTADADPYVATGVAMGHSYEASWVWAEDYTSATLTLTCSRCGDVQTVTTTDIVENEEENTYTATATYDGVTYTDVITAYTTGLYAMSDGTTRYYEDGEFQSDFEGFVKQDGLWYRVENGLLNLEFTGLGYQSTNGYYYYAVDGIVDFTFNGFLKKANGEDNYWWYVKNGMYRPTFTGLALQTDGYYYYAVDGKVDFTWTGFAKKYDETDTYWWYVKNGMYRPTYTGLGLQTDGYYYYAVDGKVDFTFTGFVKLDGSWYYIKRGMSRPDFTGLGKQTDGTYYYAVDGIVDFSYTGFIKHTDNKYYYVLRGRVRKGFTGLALQTDGNYYYAVDGVVDFSFTGFVKMDGDWWYVLRGRMRPDYTGLGLQTDGYYYYAVDGKVDFTFTGFVKLDGYWYYIKNGMSRPTFTGLAKQTDGNYYYAENGIVNFDFTGIVEHTNGKSYYVRNGMVRFNYTGTVTYNGETYNVVKGVVS